MTRGTRSGHGMLLVSGLVAILIAVGMGVLVAWDGRRPFGIDATWMEDVIGYRGDVIQGLSMVLNHIGGGWIAILVIPIGGAVAFVFARRPWSALAFLLASAVSAGLCQLFKALFGRLRPEDILLPLQNGSFPSGHATNAAVIAVLLGLLLRRGWVWVLGTVYVVAMAFSRTVLGAHWVSDTVAGMLLGAGTALIVYWLLIPRLRQEPLPGVGYPSGSATRSRTK